VALRTYGEKGGGKEPLTVLVEAGSSQYMAEKRDPFAYVAKYITKQKGDLHFGGTLQDVNFSEFLKSLKAYGRKEIVKSPDLDSRFFHMNNPRRKK